MSVKGVKMTTKKATFAMGCFWGPDSLYGATKGVLKTRVGYTGGNYDNPTYHNIADHSEAIDIDYNPEEVTYNDLIKLFWTHHDPTEITTTQYTSIIFYHDIEQKEIAETTMKEQAKKRREVLVTKIKPFKKFYDAEDYHQKYRLQQYKTLMDAIGLSRGPLLKSSHLAARLNGYVIGYGGVKQFNNEVDSLGLDEETAETVRKLIVKYGGHG